jgi:hypothetical protein
VFRSDTSHQLGPGSPEATTGLPVALSPEWIVKYCADAARTIKRPVLCPALASDGIVPTENIKVLRPSPEGYVFEGETATHLVFAASKGGVEGDYGAMQHLGAARVRGRSGQWLYAPKTGGIHANHLVLTWREGGFHYTISAHTNELDTEERRDELIALAEGMRLSPDHQPSRPGNIGTSLPLSHDENINPTKATAEKHLRRARSLLMLSLTDRSPISFALTVSPSGTR